MTAPNLILASNSPRRKALLEQIDLQFEIIPSSVHEDFTVDLAPVEFARHYARLKAAEVAASHPESMIIGADTIVVLDGHILGKPRDAADSFRMLRALSGRTHTVITGVSLQWRERSIEDTFHVATDVTFRKIAAADIEYYIRRYQPLDKAGSYGIQDWFATCIEKIDGCFYNVVGFPLATFYERFRALTGDISG
ncbi:MAG: Maf family protein [Candidatus Neomarinimicrobiota bacterium]